MDYPGRTGSRPWDGARLGLRIRVLFFMLFCIYLALAQMWNLLAGYSGLISLGQQSFVGMGGYTVAVLSSYYGINIWLAVGLAGLTSVLLALFMSLFIFRMKGVYFSIGTWIFAEALLVWFSNWAYVKYGSGLFIKPSSEVTWRHLLRRIHSGRGLGGTRLYPAALPAGLGVDGHAGR